MSRRTALAKSWRRRTSGSASSSSTCRLDLSRSSMAYSRAKRSGSEWHTTSIASSTKDRGTGKLGAGGCSASVPNRSGSPPSTCQTTALAGTPASARSRAASRQPSKSSGAESVTRCASIMGPSRSTSGGEQLQLLLFRTDERPQVGTVDEQRRAPVRRRDEWPHLRDRKRQPCDIVEPQLAPSARRKDAIDRFRAEPG